MANKKTYYVGEKASFSGNGRIYKPGDEIDGSLFSETDLEAHIKGEKLLTEEQYKALCEKKDGGKPAKKEGKKPEVNPPKKLDDMNLDELKAYAKEKNISTKTGILNLQNMNRDEMLAAIKEAEKGGN